MTLVCSGMKAQAQENVGPAEPIDESLLRAEQDIRYLESPKLFRDQQAVALRARNRLKAILQSNPDDNVRVRVAQDMIPLDELLGEHDLAIGEFYLSRGHGGLRGARDRLAHALREFPHYSKTDRVLLRLAETYLREEDPDAARRYLLKMICNYPASEYSINAFDRLNQIGFGVWEGCDKYKQ